MESTTTKTYAPWFVNLMNTYNTKAEELQLDQDVASELRQLFIDKCREQYAAGNKSGIAWMHREQEKAQSGSKEATSAGS